MTTEDIVPQTAGRLSARGWTLGPNHPDHGQDLLLGSGYLSRRQPRERRPYTRPSAYHCSACGAEKPSGRALCPCGAYAKPRGGAQ